MVDMYSGRKRVNYTQAMQSLSASDARPSDAYLKTFVKAEKIDFEKKSDPAPRIIQPRNPRFNLALGVFLKPLEHTIYEAINKIFGSKTVMKNLNASEQAAAIRAAWEAVEDPVAVDLDASRWERHVSVPALKWEHRIYLKYFHGAPHDRLRKLLSWQLRNKCRAYLPDGICKWEMDGRRSSGDMNTAVGNVVIMVGVIHSFCADVGITGYRLINNGDDSVLIISKRHVPLLGQIDAWFANLGFLMKVGEVTPVFERIQFCQTQPVFDGDKWVMCRDPRTVLAKDAHSIAPLDLESTMRGWIGAVGECGLALAGNLPVFNEYYSWMVRNGTKNHGIIDDPTMETGMRWLALRMNAGYSEPSVEARVSFWRAFGIDGTDQRRVETHYRDLGGKFVAPGVVPEWTRPEQLVYKHTGSRGSVLR
jgi:hypothetical protein